MASQDYEVMRKLWEMRIPVQFRLDHDVRHHAEPYYTMLSRSTYFPLIMRDVVAHFCAMMTDFDATNAWLECHGTPLKWFYPIGVLYDMLTAQGHTPQRPWIVTVKLSNPPQGLAAKVNLADVESTFIHSVKEADSLKRERMLMKEMKMQEHKQMWEGLINDRFEQFWEVNKKLISGEMKHLPMRFYEKDTPFKQILITPTGGENEEKRTLGNCIKLLKGEDFDCSQWDLVSYGIALPPETPALWLCKNYAYPDNFAHIAIVKRE
ncbi:hypothetical protein L596_010996 [Steinernema carpocapsae]|uniref:Autophagy protein 5 n=1 Tax=Steinernema carpocapsae TaxID=34508 RepID=A0A4V6A4B3_STECR|nr:hypothetical protein L596_010996 [Steinernema carpocapsae]